MRTKDSKILWSVARSIIGKEEEVLVVVVAAAANSWKHEWQLVQPNHTLTLLCGRCAYDAAPMAESSDTHTQHAIRR